MIQNIISIFTICLSFTSSNRLLQQHVSIPQAQPHVELPNTNSYLVNIQPFPQGMEEHYCYRAGQCANVVTHIYNVQDSFRFQCEVAGSCSDSNITIFLNQQTSDIEMFDGIFCKEGRKGLMKGACEGVIFTLDNQQFGGHSIEIEKIECSGLGSCNNMQIIIGLNTKINELYCDPGQCDGCVVKIRPTDAGVPCMSLGSNPYPY
eukprot:UN02457